MSSSSSSRSLTSHCLLYPELKEAIQTGRAIRVGCTKSIESRRAQYFRKGFNGKMFYSEAYNMKEQETELLALHFHHAKGGTYNVHKTSNGKSTFGYVYGLEGHNPWREPFPIERKEEEKKEEIEDDLSRQFHEIVVLQSILTEKVTVLQQALHRRDENQNNRSLLFNPSGTVESL